MANSGYRKEFVARDKEKLRAYQREWLARRRADWLELHGPCIKCGNDNDLQIDHIDPSQKISHNVWSWTEKRRQQELSKCQVLCKACHLKKTLEQRRKTEHGKLWMYIKGCRCDICKKSKSESDKKYKRRVPGNGSQCGLNPQAALKSRAFDSSTAPPKSSREYTLRLISG